MKLKNLFLIFVSFLVLTLSFVSADYRFQNDSGIDLLRINSINGNFSVLGNVSAQNFVGSGEFLTDLNIDIPNLNYWNKSGNNLFYLDGNIGIGTSSPSEKIDTTLDFRLTNGGDYINFEGAGGDYMILRNALNYITVSPMNADWGHIYSSTNNFLFNKAIYTTANKFGAYYTGNLELQTNGNTRLFINKTNGNVGINTTIPQNKLNVIGDGNFTGELYANGNRIDNLNATGLITNWSTNLDLSDYVPYSGGNSNLNLSGQNISADFFIGDGSQITGISSSSSAWNETGSDIYYDSGKVGINTSTPETALQVNGDFLIGLASKLILSHASSSDDDWSIGAEGENLLIREKDDSNKFYFGIYDDARIAMGVGDEILKVTSSEVQVQDTIRFKNPLNIGSGTKDILLEAFAYTQSNSASCVWSGGGGLGSCSALSGSYPSPSCGTGYSDTTVLNYDNYNFNECFDKVNQLECEASNYYWYTRTYCKGWKIE